MRIIKLAYLIIALSFLVSAYYYPLLPEQIATHWGLSGEADGYSSKAIGLLFLPVLSVVLIALLYFVPRIDPLKKNISKFRDYYEGFIVLMAGFLLYIHLITIFWNTGMQFNIIQVMTPAFAALFYYIGIMLQHAKRNWFIGIRTPWTLSSDKVWDKTHKVGSKIFRAAGILSLLGIAFPAYALWFTVGVVVAGAIFTVVYSYVEFRKLKRKP